MSDAAILDMARDAVTDKVVSFMDEMDEAVKRGADAMQAFMEDNKVKATFAETGIIILYGDALSNKATDHGKFKVCLTSGHKDTLKLLLQEALKVLEEPNG